VSLPGYEGWIHIQTHRLRGEIYEVAVEMGSAAMIYIPSSIKIGSGIQKLIWVIHKHTEKMEIANLL
jgi:hypothetical protein